MTDIHVTLTESESVSVDVEDGLQRYTDNEAVEAVERDVLTGNDPIEIEAPIETSAPITSDDGVSAESLSQRTYIEAGRTVAVPADHQTTLTGELAGEGEITGDGELVVSEPASETHDHSRDVLGEVRPLERVSAGSIAHVTHIEEHQFLEIPERQGSVVAGPLTGEGKITGNGRLKII